MCAALIAAIPPRKTADAPKPPPDVPALDAVADKTVFTMEDARRRRLFWTQFSQGTGLAIRLLDDPELFESVFPGYRRARGDRELWRDYFLDFEQSTFSPVLMRTTGRLAMINTSWLGSLALYKKYGADIVLLGNSETFQNIPSGLLRDMLEKGRDEASRSLRVLSCGRSYMMPRTAALSAEAMAESGRAAKLVIWGYSRWNAGNADGDDPTDASALAAYLKSRRVGRRFLAGFDWPFEAVPTWDKLVPLGVQNVWNQKQAVARDRLSLMPDALARDPAAVDAFAARLASARAPSRGGSGKVCGIAEASADLDKALAAILRAADKALVFVPPTTDLVVPPCAAEIDAMLRSKAGPRVMVVTDDWRSYGLRYHDYVWPSETPGISRLDGNHVNYAGAKKVTARIAEWANRAQGDSAARSPRLYKE